MSENSIIELKDITKKYGDNTILQKFSLSIPKGEFITIIGSSGCGKTTVLKLINGLISPDEGKIFVKGDDISGIDQIKLRRNIGYVIQHIGLFPHMNVRKNIAYILNLYKEKDKELIEEKVKNLIKILDLDEEILNKYPNELSGGQKQRVGIARALISNPEILLMDEPFCSVDEITRKILQQAIIEIHKKLGVTIIFITHDIKEALKLGTKVVVMNKGNIIQYDSPQEIVKNPKDDFVRELIGDNN